MIFRVRTATGVAVAFALFLSLPVGSTAAEHVVQIIGTSFVPQNIQIIQGDKIRWVNSSALIHTTTSGTGCSPNGFWDSGILAPTDEFIHTFNTAGSFPYYCIPHCLIGMTGVVQVDGTVGTNDSTWGKIKALYGTGGR